jgi:hypothetical protein
MGTATFDVPYEGLTKEILMEPNVTRYVEAIPPQQRPLFDRVQRLVLDACPQGEIAYLYKMPTYKVGKRRLHVAAWAHGLSIYGWKAHGDGGFTERHPETQTSTGTIRLTEEIASTIKDDEIRALARSALTL